MSAYETAELEADEPIDEHTAAYDRIDVADVGAGLLVYGVETEYRNHLGRDVPVAKTLVGFSDVTDWAGVRDALISRGHGVGAVHHLPVFDVSTLPNRDQKADGDRLRNGR